MTYRPVRNPTEFFQGLVKDVMMENPVHKFHLGKMILNAMRKHPKYATNQIDGTTGKELSIGSVLDRSAATAQAFRNIGLKVGDVVTVMGRNHLDIPVPLYANLLCGVAFMGMDMLLSKTEAASLLRIARPKLVFCETVNLPIISEISKELGFKIVTFTKSADDACPSYQEFLDQHRSEENYDDFEATDLIPEETTALLCCTSGSTGTPKLADITHANIAPILSFIMTCTGNNTDMAIQCRAVMCIAPIYWITSSLIHLQSVLYCFVVLKSSGQVSPKAIAGIVNKYRPPVIAMTSVLAQVLLKQPEDMEWSCFHTFGLAGSAVTEGLIDNINNLIGRPVTTSSYGLTEACGRVFYMSDNTVGSLGVPIPYMQAKIVDQNTDEEVGENTPGELLIRGPFVCRRYYNDPENTKASFTADGWFRTGDLVFKNSKQHYFYVDRLKALLNTIVDSVHYHVSPIEIENKIKKVAGVVDAAVTGVKRDDFDVPLALVVKKNGLTVTVQHIQEHVRKHLSKSKHLTGGVMFVESIPLLHSGKVNRLKVRDMANHYYNMTRAVY